MSSVAQRITAAVMCAVTFVTTMACACLSVKFSLPSDAPKHSCCTSGVGGAAEHPQAPSDNKHDHPTDSNCQHCNPSSILPRNDRAQAEVQVLLPDLEIPTRALIEGCDYTANLDPHLAPPRSPANTLLRLRCALVL